MSSDGTTLNFASSYVGPVNGGFEQYNAAQALFSGWTWQDEGGVRTIQDTTVFHSGNASAKIVPGSGNARIVQT